MLFLINFSLSQLWIDARAYFNNYYNLKRTFNLAEKYYNEGNLPKARENYMKIEEKASKIIILHDKSRFLDDALYMLAVSYSRIGEYSKAEQKFKEFFTFFPNSKLIKKVKLEYGIMLYNANRLDEAILHLSQIKDKEAKIYLMKTYFKMGNYQKAKEIASSLLKYKEIQNNLDFKITLANIYLNTRDLENAQELISQIVKFQNVNDTTKNNLLLMLSDAYVQEKNYEKALDIISKIEYKDSTSSEFFIKLKTAKIYLLKADTNSAINILEYLSNFAFDSTKYWSYYYLGIIYENKEDFDKALDFYEKANEGLKIAKDKKEVILKLKSMKDEKDFNKLYNLAETFLIDLNKPDLALETLNKIINEGDDYKIVQKSLLFAIYISSRYLNDKEKANFYYEKLKESWMIDIAKSWIYGE
ncbi:MAG: tetratricopeptide repeat protein [candidate division WOR-3 bacterium]